MAIQTINIGTTANDGTGDTLRSGGDKINGNFTELDTNKLNSSDYNASDVKTKYESNTDTNAYTDTEKTKLSGIEANAQVNTVTSVAGKTGVITLDKNDVGLSNVDNTSDLNKPISTATQTALDGKANTGDIFSGDYNDLTNTPTIPTTLSELSGDLDDIPNGTTYIRYTPAEQTKLLGIEAGAEVNTINSDPTGITGADQVTNVVSLTQAEYDVITPDASTFYIITG